MPGPRASTVHVGADHTRHPLRVSTPIGRAYQVPTAFFLSNVLPSLHPDLDLDALIDKGTFRNAVTMQGKLWGYSKKSPSGIHRKDTKQAFASLQRGVRVIVKAIGNIKAKLAFNNNTEGEYNFAERTDDSLPDAFFILRSATSDVVKWADIAVLGEYKRENTEESVEENIDKICQTMTNCMREDPRRRFAYGFTAEDANMKMWYFDRSQVVCSDPFSFIENFRILLHFIVALTYAELPELGWDPTMTVLNRDGPVQYDITVRSDEAETAVYRTLEVLSDSSARHVLGRGTRVWKAVKIVDGEQVGEPVALKDAWVDSSREREGDITTRVRQSQSLADDHTSVDQYFLTIERHGDVFVNGVQDRTRGFFVPLSRPGRHVPNKMSGETSNATQKASTFPFQAHYRVVFKEVGTPLGQVTSLHTVFKILTDVMHGIMAVHKSGWVHRDLSTGNILIVNNTGKITDFEYATKLDEQQETGRTGTPNFVAVEVDNHTYIFQPPPTPSILSRLPDVSEEVWLARALGQSKESTPEILEELAVTRHHTFRFNPLHDLESLWWIAVYFVINREIDSEDATLDEDKRHTSRITPQQAFAEELFYNLHQRYNVIKDNTYFTRNLNCLHPRMMDIGRTLDKARHHLRGAYVTAEQSIETISLDVATDLYVQFLRCLQAIIRPLGRQDIKIRRFKRE